MMAPHAGLERRVLASLDAAPSRVPVVLGGCGTGRTTLLHGVADRLGRRFVVEAVEGCPVDHIEVSAS